MMIVYFILLITAMVIVMGLVNSDEYEFGIELIHPRFNSFEIGISNRNYSWDNGDEEQELRIGLFIATISVSFFRNSA